MLLFYLQYNKGVGGSRQGQLTGRGGNRRLPLAALHNRDFVVWAGHFVSLLSVIGGWGGVFLPHFGQKKAGDLFQISCSVCRCMGGGYLVIKVRGKLTRCVWNNKLEFTLINIFQTLYDYQSGLL